MYCKSSAPENTCKSIKSISTYKSMTYNIVTENALLCYFFKHFPSKVKTIVEENDFSEPLVWKLILLVRPGKNYQVIYKVFPYTTFSLVSLTICLNLLQKMNMTKSRFIPLSTFSLSLPLSTISTVL